VSPRHRFSVLAFALAGALGCERAPQPAADVPAAPARPANVLVYLVDTLRADHLGCYGYRRAVSPAIDGLASEAILFENAVAVSSWTRPTVASLLTGLSPAAHGVRKLEDALAENAETLPEILAAAGYATAGFSPNWHVSRKTGLAQGFTDFEFFPDDTGSESLTRRVLAWLDRQPADRPWMIYAHALDPHAPYRPAADLKREFAPSSTRPEAGSHEDIVATLKKRRRDRGDRVAELRDLYDAELADTDRHFGHLLDALRERGLYGNTLVVFLSDHGEGFDEHARLGHGNTLYGELLNIPLLIKRPGRHAAARTGDLASQLDVLPTLLAALGLPARMLPGRDLLAPLAGETAPVVAQLTYERRRGLALITRDWKYIEPRSHRFGAARELYSRLDDPLDANDLAGARPDKLAEMARRLQGALQPEVDAPRVETDDEGERALRALGYL
jgi:arylsulfatase A-like enzyme